MNITYKHEISTKTKPQEIIDLLLKSRNIKDIDSFLNPPSPLEFTLKDFGFKQKEISPMMRLLTRIKKNDEMIIVYTDYDADGITGGAVLWETLHLLGFKVMPYVPHRKTEGYGFSKKGIDNVKKEFNPTLIMSVDHGITAKKEVEYANKRGIDVIITDHHHRQEEKVPDSAVCIFHIPTLSGSGTAYMVAKELCNHFCHPELDLGSMLDSRPACPAGGSGSRMTKKLEKYFKLDYLALAAIGTVADLVPLVGPSRSIVTYGLKSFSKVDRPGIKHILKEAQIEDKEIRPYEIGFIIAPRINAVGRLEHALDALRLLCTTDEKRARELAQKVGDLNTNRQDLVKEQVAEAQAQMKKFKVIPKLIILYSDHWHEGVIGLIAGNILEEYYRPTIVMTKGDGFYKASVRSIPGFHITDFLKTLDSYLTNFGGHAAAAGFTLKGEKLEKFLEVAVKKAEKILTEDMLERTLEVDMKIPLLLATKPLVHALEKLAPFGMGNAKPTFTSEASVVHAKILGKQRNHLKLQVKDVSGQSLPLDMIAFGQAEIFKQLSKNQKITLVYHLDLNEWNGQINVQGMVKHVEL